MPKLSNFVSSIKGGKRFLVVVAVIVGLALAGLYLTSGEAPVPKSEIVNSQGKLKNIPASNAPTQQMQELIAQADKDREKKAQETGGSAMKTVTALPTLSVPSPSEDRNKQNDLSGITRPDPPVQRPVVTPVVMPAQVAPVHVATETGNDNLADLMKKQMEMIAKNGFGASDVKYYYKDDKNTAGQTASATGSTPSGNGSSTTAQQAAGAGASAYADTSGYVGGVKMPLPGTIIYAEMVSTANSDTPGPVLAKILQGDFAGATVIGTFSTQKESIVITFNTMTMGTMQDGTEVNKSVSINAVAVDSANIGTAMATDVNHHILSNVAFTAAAAFAQGLSSALSQSGSTYTVSATGTTVTNPSLTFQKQLLVGAGTAGAAAGQSLDKIYGNRATTIKVASGTPFGLLFLGNGNTNSSNGGQQ